jgi:ComF family protein
MRGVCKPCLRELPWNRPACSRCAMPVAGTEQQPACAHCTGRPPSFDAAWAPLRYAPPVDTLVHGFKFHARLADGRLLAELMALALTARVSPLPELVVPVPLHRWRLLRRGFNQAQELARGLQRHFALPLRADLVRRLRHTPQQSAQHTAAQRDRNLRGAFAVSGQVAGRHVALLDDVVTTGATAGELARAMKRAGAASVEVWAAARTP